MEQFASKYIQRKYSDTAPSYIFKGMKSIVTIGSIKGYMQMGAKFGSPKVISYNRDIPIYLRIGLKESKIVTEFKKLSSELGIQNNFVSSILKLFDLFGVFNKRSDNVFISEDNSIIYECIVNDKFINIEIHSDGELSLAINNIGDANSIQAWDFLSVDGLINKIFELGVNEL